MTEIKQPQKYNVTDIELLNIIYEININNNIVILVKWWKLQRQPKAKELYFYKYKVNISFEGCESEIPTKLEPNYYNSILFLIDFFNSHTFAEREAGKW